MVLLLLLAGIAILNYINLNYFQMALDLWRIVVVLYGYTHLLKVDLIYLNFIIKKNILFLLLIYLQVYLNCFFIVKQILSIIGIIKRMLNYLVSY